MRVGNARCGIFAQDSLCGPLKDCNMRKDRSAD